MSITKLPIWFSVLLHVLPWSLCLYFFSIALTNPEQMDLYLSRDSLEGAGLVENLTVIILIPGIVAGLYGFFRFRSVMKHGWTAYWLLLWTLACVYFAGEEISWGQWFFQWNTPEDFAQINDQNETNLHNISSWFDQKPRALVELWIFIGGVIMPFYSLLQRKPRQMSSSFWLHPIPQLISAGMFFTIVRISRWMEIYEFNTLFGSSELRELCVALFLSLFLISFPVRAHMLK
mgnify:FL=1